MAGRESSWNASSGQAESSVSGARGGKKDKPRPTLQNRGWGTRLTGDAPTARRKEHRLKPVLLRESRKLEKAIRKKNEKLRSKYRAVHGKVVDWVDHAIEDGYLFVSIRFQDKTDFSLQFSPKIVADEIDLCDVRSGNFRLVRQYFRRREE